MANIQELGYPSIPSFLSDVLTKINPPRPITPQYLAQLGVELIEAKQAHVDLENSNVQARLRRRIPDKINFDEAALTLMTLFTFKNIRVSERSTDYLLGIYVDHGEKEGIYITSRKELYRLIDPLVPYYRNKEIDDVLDKIERMVPTVVQTSDPSLFIVNNGIYNQASDELMPFSPDYTYLVKIPVNYVDNPKSPIIIDPNDNSKWDVESWLESLAGDDDTATLIWEVIADTLQPSRSRGRSIWFYSESGNNGKGTIGQLIKNLLGIGNYSSLSVTEFKHEYMKETLIGVAANIADENDVDVYIDSVRDYKASVTGDDININRKYEKPVRLQFKGTNIQMMNGLPKTRDKSDSFYRRLILVPFLQSFTNNGEKKYIKDIYIARQDVLEFVLWKALHMKFNEFTIPAKSESLLYDYKEMNNPVMQFWNELHEEFQWDLLPTQFLYDLFVQWSNRNNPTGKPMGKSSFVTTLNNLLKDSPEWIVKTGQNDKVKTGSKLDADEPLITEYNLVGWKDKSYMGSNLKRSRQFTRAATYRGYLKR